MSKSHLEAVEEMVRIYEEEILRRLNEKDKQQTKFGDRVADRIAAFGGSWKFILIFFTSLLLWITWNLVVFTKHFDEPPFILLNLILSFVASFQAPIIMMSQNRQAARDKHESMIDFAINYKAEAEVADMKNHLHRIEAEVLWIRQILKEIQEKN